MKAPKAPAKIIASAKPVRTRTDQKQFIISTVNSNGTDQTAQIIYYAHMLFREFMLKAAYSVTMNIFRKMLFSF